MRRIIVLIVSAAINASTIPAVTADSTSNKAIDAARTRSATVPGQLANAADNEKACRAYAASFYESATLRQAAARYADGERTLALLDSVINAFNDLLATRCGS
jgi:Asp/Glu/hydantoin racemase